MKDKILQICDGVGIDAYSFFAYAYRHKYGKDQIVLDEYLVFTHMGLIPEFVKEFIEYIESMERCHEDKGKKTKDES